MTRTPEAARAELAELRSTKGRRCVEVLAIDALRRAGARPTGVEVTPVPLSVPESDADVAYVVEARGVKSGREVGAIVMMLGSLVGQTEVSLSVRLGGRRVTFTEANILLIAAVARARELTP